MGEKRDVGEGGRVSGRRERREGEWEREGVMWN